ncbi:glutathione S-transferase family protein [Massilia sp. CF038]|jgi:glutathione S-transferase|uniref:glutathione S-transferase family protein n=1 Tax=Massilia sp. CF038 TaxID=1881045 RepID=UPI00091C121D|nr:glutathione S-transferase family protein [Massilia sp. CF038]SHH56765.1 glutathione S-transferase [Massilia sp. CF038]
MRLYHNPLSSNARRVQLTAQLLGIELELVHVDLASDADRRRLQEINPNGKLPVLTDGDFVLWESCAIMQYLCDLAPEQTLYPLDPRARADVNRWMFWACQHFAPAVGVLTYENIWKGMMGRGEADPRELARGERDLLQFGAVVDAQLAGREWMAGQSLTLADLALAPSFMYIERGRLPLERFPNLMAWWARIQALPVWQNTSTVW